jgi:hypothetical protein
VVGAQKQAIAEQRLETARPSRRCHPAPQRTQRKHGTEPDRSNTTDGYDRRQRRRLSSDDRPYATHDKDSVDRPGPAIVRFSEDVVEHFVELIATTLEVPESNNWSRPRRNDHGRPEVDIGLPLVHACESMRMSSQQPADVECLPRGRLDVASGDTVSNAATPATFTFLNINDFHGPFTANVNFSPGATGSNPRHRPGLSRRNGVLLLQPAS